MISSAVRSLARLVKHPEWLTTTAANPRTAVRVISCCPAALENESDTENGDGGNVLVDPSKDASLQDLFIIPIRKPLVPGGIPLFEKIIDQPLIQQIKQMEQLNSTVRVGLFVRNLGPRSTTSENEQATQDDQLKPLDGLEAEHLEEVGTLGVLKGFSVGVNEQGQEVAHVGVQALRRIRRQSTLQRAPLKLQCRPIPDDPYNKEDPDIRATHQELTQALKSVFEQAPVYLEQMRHVRTGDFQDLARFADLAVSLVNGTAHDLQDFLTEGSVPQRMLKALAIVKKELELLQLQRDISRRVEEKFTKEQKRYFLMEQMKHIQKELGITKDEKGQVIQKFIDRFEPIKHNAPEEVQQAVEEEIGKLRVLETASSEYNVSRNYLDWLTSMPYGVYNEEKFDIAFARQCLDEDHYGMQDVKDGILEFIAVGKLNNAVQGKIICMVGPPGVGKTSIGKSIANSLGRKFFRFSVGGLSDVAEIKGHRRTYIGAMPGKLVQCLKQVHSSNPLVLIDEIDKLGRGMQGDPASALLELLDPEQNHSFRDHYLDVPLDLSKVLFICTANVLDTIPRPLLDRMEVIELSGYTGHEKTHIAREYLEKEVRGNCAIPEGSVELTDGALECLIQQYCRESGVRNLKKQLEKVYRKSAMTLATSDKLEWIEEEVPAEDEKAGEGSEAPSPDTKSEAGSLDVASASDTSDTSSGTLPSDEPASGAETDAKVQAEKTKEPVMRKRAVYHGEPIVVDQECLDKYLGKPPFDSDRFYDVTPPGVVMGLAWTSMGGSTLYVESNKVSSSGTPSLTITGQLGDVMKESMTIAQTYARGLVRSMNSDNTMLEEGVVHLHVPQGATPKDGPSAGCTAVTALLSLAMNEPVAPDVAMTGEISLSGHLLPIGGVKEKALAAKRSGVSKIMLPEANRRDWQELSEEVREGIEPKFSKHYLQMIPILFPSLAESNSSHLAQLHDELRLPS